MVVLMRRLSHACAQTRTIGAGVLDRQIRVVVEYCGEFREAAFIIRWAGAGKASPKNSGRNLKIVLLFFILQYEKSTSSEV